MRNSLILLSMAALVAACSEQQPTSPAAAKSEAVGLMNAGDARFPVGSGIKLPDAKPTDQVGFTTIDYVEGAVTTVPAGQSVQGMALCPAGAFATGGGFQLNNSPGTTPVPTYSRLIVVGPQYGWSVVLNNKAAGAANVTFLVDVVCVH